MHSAVGQVVGTIARANALRPRQGQSAETAQVRAFLEAGHPFLAFSILIVRRFGTCAALALALLLCR